jgi:hypothetical protein
MDSGTALKLIVDLSLVLFLLRPIVGMLVDAFKVMIRMALVGLVLNVIPLNFIDDWSKAAATDWAHITAVYVPVIALIFLVALSTANLIFLSGTTAEQIGRIVFYVIGGVFTVGSVQWLQWEQSIGSVASGVVGILTHTLGIFGVVI